MCASGPYGIPITNDIQVLLPADVTEAWEKFHSWWEADHPANNIVHKADIPADIWEAMLKVIPTPIPGYEGKILADSCYWMYVLAHMDEPPAGF